MLILDLWDISFHAVVVFGLGKDILFKSVQGCCVFRKKILEIRSNLTLYGHRGGIRMVQVAGTIIGVGKVANLVWSVQVCTGNIHQ